MGGWLGILVGALAAAATYLLMGDRRVQRALGLIFLSHAANLLVFAMTGAVHRSAPLVAPGAQAPTAPFTDPLPQALVLTAIVIGFALQAFALVLLLVPAASPDPRPAPDADVADVSAPTTHEDTVPHGKPAAVPTAGASP